MAKLTLKPQFGTIEQASNISYEITGLPQLGDDERYKLEFENATLSKSILVVYADEISNSLDLGLPDDFSQSLVTVFAHVYREINGESERIEICSAVFGVVVAESKDFDGELIIEPSIIGPKHSGSIKILSSPNTKTVFSINNKQYPILTKDDGTGSIHFRGEDLLEVSSVDIVQKYPIYFYSAEDNYTSKHFTGSYVSVIPHQLATLADRDPRCDDPDYDPYTWTAPPECYEEPEVPDQPGTPIDPTVDPADIPTYCTEDEAITTQDFCRIRPSRIAALSDGSILQQFATAEVESTDATEIQRATNRLYRIGTPGSMTTQGLFKQVVAVESKTVDSNFRIHITSEAYSYLEEVDNPSVSDIYVYLHDKAIGYQSIKLIGREIDEYTGSFIVLGRAEDTNVTISGWLLCVPAVFYRKNTTLDFIDSSLANFQNGGDMVINRYEENYGTSGEIPWKKILNFDFATNIYHVPRSTNMLDEGIVAIVSEVMDGNYSQLYLKSYSYYTSSNSAYSSSDEFGTPRTEEWLPMTSSGNNKNPKILVDTRDSLHVIWESDRSGNDQLYYGCLGTNLLSNSHFALSSCFDKYASLLRGDIESDIYLSVSPLISATSSEYSPIPEYDTQSLVDNEWVVQSSASGSVTKTDNGYYLEDLTISANPLEDTAIAVNSMVFAEESGLDSAIQYDQINYQVSFSMNMSLTQNDSILTSIESSYDDKEIDEIFDSWKSGFDIDTSTSSTNCPTYSKNNNRFIIGRKDNIYDRMVPLFGAYEHGSSDPSDLFEVKILKEDNNVKDFVFGIMLEKSRFKATNVQSYGEYESTQGLEGYIPSEEHEVYTGKAKMVALVKTQEDNDLRSDYFIAREFPEEFDISRDSRYEFIVTYRRIDSEEVIGALGVYDGSYEDRFVGIVTLLKDGILVFSQSFISTLDFNYPQIDFGFGVPYGGYYLADKMTPHKMSIYDNIQTTMNISNIQITSPTYDVNRDIISVADNVMNMTKFRVSSSVIADPSVFTEQASAYYDNRDEDVEFGFIPKILYTDMTYVFSHNKGETNTSSLYDVRNIDTIIISELEVNNNTYRIYDETMNNLIDEQILENTTEKGNYVIKFNVSQYDYIYFQIENTDETSGSLSTSLNFYQVFNASNLTQVPITMEGINNGLDISLGYCDDVHIAWQSNRDNYWNIYTSNSTNKYRPFRFDTKITDTTSNSLSPSVAVSRSGKRMITWHDNRDGEYSIYAARSLSGYECSKNTCDASILEGTYPTFVECACRIQYNVPVSGLYNFIIQFYSDTNLTDLVASVNSQTSDKGWYINNQAFDVVGTYTESALEGVQLTKGSIVEITYIPQKEDGIFDQILYAKITGSI